MKKLIPALQGIDQNGFSDSEKTTLQKFIKTLVDSESFISRLFNKTVSIPIPVHPVTFSVNKESVLKFFKPVFNLEIGRANRPPFIEVDVWNLFEDIVVSGFTTSFSSTVYRCVKKTKCHRKILSEAERTSIKRIYTYIEALSIAREIFLTGQVDKMDKVIIIYFRVGESGNLCVFTVSRESTQEQFCLYVDKVEIGEDGVVPANLCAGDGVCFNDNTSDV